MLTISDVTDEFKWVLVGHVQIEILVYINMVTIEVEYIRFRLDVKEYFKIQYLDFNNKTFKNMKTNSLL